MTSCPDCQRAETDPFCGIVHANCRGCAVRSVSDSPEWARELYYEKIRDAERKAQFRADVEAEARRRLELRQKAMKR